LRQQEIYYNLNSCIQVQTEEFDHGSDWTLAACLTHASRTVTRGQPWRRVADGWVIH